MGFFSPSKWECKASVAVSQKTQLRVKAPPPSVFAPGAIKREIQEFVPFFDNKRPICRLCSLFLGNSSICFIQKWDNFVCYVRPKTQKKRAVPPLLENFCTSDGNFLNEGVSSHTSDWVGGRGGYKLRSTTLNIQGEWTTVSAGWVLLHTPFSSLIFSGAAKKITSITRQSITENYDWISAGWVLLRLPGRFQRKRL